MMLNIRVLEIYSKFSIYLPLAFFLGIILLGQIIIIFLNNLNWISFNNIIVYIKWYSYINIKINAIGELLFNECYILFIGATLLLFIAMIGSIVLTLDKNKKKK